MSEQSKKVIAGTKNLKVYFTLGKKQQYVRAVDDVSLNIYQKEVLGLVGESGSGKSTYGRALLRLIEPSAGKVFFNQIDITKKNTREMRPLRKKMQMVFQDPNSSLNPRMRIKDIIGEPLYVNKIGTRKEQTRIINDVIERVHLSKDYLNRYPYQLSGGQRQRVAIARALVTKPDILIADEPVSALDVSVQAQILNLLTDLRQQLGLSILMISHDLSVVEYFSDRVAVMYLGKIMEVGKVEDVFKNPVHPYTKALLDSVPEPDPSYIKDVKPIEGDIPSPLKPPSGCVFRTRCPRVFEDCATVIPSLTTIHEGHQAACLLTKNEENQHGK